MSDRQTSPVLVEIRVVPRSGRSGVAGMRDGAVLVRLKAAPVEGAANKELVAVLADALDVPKRNITIVSGERSRTKKVHIEGVGPGRLEALSRQTD